MTALRDAFERWAYDVFDGAVMDMPDLIRPNAPLGTAQPESDYVPGATRESIAVGQRPAPSPPMFAATVVAPTPQARFSDQGTEPHEIVPRGPGYPLRFYWPKAGGVVHFMHVNHPGNAAQRWWEPAVREAFAAALVQRANSTSMVSA